MLKRRYLIVFLWLVCFVLGSYVWKILHTGTFFQRPKVADSSLADVDFSVYVGDYLITHEDIKWEYDFYLRQADAGLKEGLSKNQLSDKEGPFIELYNKIIADLIERKLLFQFIASDQRFDSNQASRYTHCLEKWVSLVKEYSDFFSSEKSRVQLKSMLCEKDVLDQYLTERIAVNIRLSDSELRDYFLSHKSDFIQPVRVTIRQVVLASEDEAKAVRARISPHNFANLAGELSISPEAEQGGILGPFSRGEMPSVFDVAFEMSHGEIQGILKSTYGFHIIMLERKYPKAELSFEAARVQIIGVLKKKRQEEEYRKWVEMALNTIPVKSSRGF